MPNRSATTSLKHEEQKEQMHRDALAAFAEYQKTGLHVTGDEADVWLSRLEDGQDAAAPKCHV